MKDYPYTNLDTPYMSTTAPRGYGIASRTEPPKTIFTMNKLVACSPFPKLHVEKVVKRNFALIEQKVSLQELEVVFQGENFAPGDRVFVRGDQVVQAWAKQTFTFDGKEFILVPESAVQMVVKG
jgi:small nuclear ribonucleoprotein (snRNP)-like protein